jgi:hypothetical protein
MNSESCIGNNNTINSINLNNTNYAVNNNTTYNNNISMNTTTEGSDKPVAYSSRLLAKYYKHMDNYNKKLKGILNTKKNNIKSNMEKDMKKK